MVSYQAFFAFIASNIFFKKYLTTCLTNTSCLW